MTAKMICASAALLLLCSCAGEVTLTDSQEYYVGRSAVAKTMSQYALYNPKDPALVEYLTKITNWIARTSDRPELFEGYNFIIVEDANFNACSFPSGFILITTGTIKYIKEHQGGEDELAAIIAHEIAHVNLRHPEIAAQRTTAKQEGAKVLAGAAGLAMGIANMLNQNKGKEPVFSQKDIETLSGALDGVVNFFGDVVNSGYGRDEELAADKVALDFLNRANYNPLALKMIISKLPKQEQSAKGWFNPSHPSPEDRIKQIDAEVKSRNYQPRNDTQRRDRFARYTATL